MSTKRNFFLQILLVMVVLTMACNSFGMSNDPTPTPTSTSGNITSSLQKTMSQVKQATIHIVADAKLFDIEGNIIETVPTGSGFIIDESGIAVTNNHVVTGARSYEVYVGEEQEPRRAKVLGVSECSDLAVIDLEGEGYPFLDWYEGDIFPGLEVYAAGYPLSNPEFTLTRGIVSKEEANGQTSWASVDGVIEHDATINPGNSGGPLVTREGQVVAVNYANQDSERRGVSIQYFAIARDEARQIVEQLQQEQDVLAVGLNGKAFVTEDGEFTGIWVKSVDPGSAADIARIEGGDILTSLQDQQLARNGTMEEYCETLRSHDLEDVLNVEVLRLKTGELLEGQLNGRELEMVDTISLAPNPDPQNNVVNTSEDGDYLVVKDDLNAVTIEVPKNWDQVSGKTLENWVAISASSNIRNFPNAPDTPGVLFVVPKGDISPDEFLDAIGEPEYVAECMPRQRFDYTNHSDYTGVYDFYQECGQANSNVFFLALKPKQASGFGIFMIAHDLTQEDTDHILDTFEIIGDLP